jgi:hypothetical protein
MLNFAPTCGTRATDLPCPYTLPLRRLALSAVVESIDRRSRDADTVPVVH